MWKAYPRVWVDLKTIEIIAALLRLLWPSRAAGRALVPGFEQSFAHFLGVQNAVAFPNCRSALFHALKALELEPGDEVILPAFTFWVDPAVVLLAGLKPVFVDVDFATANLDMARVEAAITPRSRVIMPVHLNGLPVEMLQLQAIAEKHDLRVIEDCARACGATYGHDRVGTLDIGAFSFGYGKSFYGFGGGMVTSNDAGFMERVRSLQKPFHTIPTREMVLAVLKGSLLKFLNTPTLHKWTLFPLVKRFVLENDPLLDGWFRVKKPHYTEVPHLFRRHMFNIQAAMGFRQIKTIDQSNRKRHDILRLFRQELAGVAGLQLPPDPVDRDHVCVHFAVWSEQCQELQRFLLHHGIDAQDESAQDVTQMERFIPYAAGPYPHAAQLNSRVCYLPAHPCLNEKDVRYIAGMVKLFFAENKNRAH
ncbi:MAG: aminotransferase class I/II-fold pyridoxal phosphate-dependent enzyme [Magnetococcales bacterium]|nr:aminotransferase class I/II-fold pyridoxal phosphate-dependent enzyme [Magnetococcales bacterium]MBF0321684.1 aminotransferase class I/II-fold pyridoxal phosphate-dependent enzyme [Magnetococcales bacterium]